MQLVNFFAAMFVEDLTYLNKNVVNLKVLLDYLNKA